MQTRSLGSLRHVSLSMLTLAGSVMAQPQSSSVDGRASLDDRVSVKPSQAEPPPEVGPPILRLELEGVSKLDESVLRDQLVTRSPSWWPFSETPRFDPERWRADLRRVPLIYARNGFHQARVLDSSILPSPGGGVVLRVAVEEGHPTIIRGVDLDGLEELEPGLAKQVRALIPFQPGERLEEEQWVGLKERLRLLLQEGGHVDARVEGEVRVHAQSASAHVALALFPGPVFQIGDLILITEPNPRVPRWRVVEQARAAVPVGSRFSRSALQLAQERIWGMGIFEAVKVAPGRPDVDGLSVPLVIQVQETAPRSVRIGPRIAIDLVRTELGVTGELIHRDLLGDLRTLRLRGHAGWSFLPDLYTALVPRPAGWQTGPVGGLAAEIVQPRLLHPDVSVYGAGEVERELRQPYRATRSGAQGGVVWRPHPNLSARVAYHLDVTWMDAHPPLTEPPAFFACPGRCTLSYLRQSVEWDTRDSRFEPSRGLFLSMSVEEVGGLLGGAASFLRVRPEGRLYWTPGGGRLTLSGRVALGAILRDPADGPVPISARFFSGGMHGMRGFRHDRMGPLQLLPTDDPAVGFTVPVGGEGLLESSLEARYLVGDALVVALFVDGGALVEGPVSTNLGRIPERLQYAVGVGLRYRTLLGPLRVDLAWRPPGPSPLPVAPWNGQQLDHARSTGCFGIGGVLSGGAGAPEDPCVLHVSIGEAF